MNVSKKETTLGYALGQTLDNGRYHEGNPRLRLERLARQWGQDDVASGLLELAGLLGETTPGIDASLVSKWERGVRNPGPHYVARLCLLFQLPPERLGFLPGPRLARECRGLSETLGRALARTLGSVRRRDLLQHLLWGGAVLACHPAIDLERIVAAASGQIDRRLVEDLQVVANEYAGRMHTDIPRDLLSQVNRHLAYVDGLLRCHPPSNMEVRLHVVAATLAAVSGKLSFNLGNPGDAHAHYLRAEGHAREAGEGSLRAFILGQRSHLYSDLWRESCDGRSPVSLQLLDAAHAAAGGISSPWLRTWLSARRAEEHAIRGDVRAARYDLEEADRSLGAAIETDDPFFAHWFESPGARLAGYRGNCAQLLGQAGEATTIIEDALSGLSPRLVSIRCTILADLATAYAKEQDPEHACALLTESLDLCSEGGLVAQVQRVARVRPHLARWQDASPVRCLDEHLHALAWVPL